MKKSKFIKIQTKGTFTNITDIVLEECLKVGHSGLVNLFVEHTTCGIKILEDEKLLLADYERILQQFAPEGEFYAHNIIQARDVLPTERINGHSHIRALFFEPSIVLPVSRGVIQLGKWQSIFLVDLDPSRERKIAINFI